MPTSPTPVSAAPAVPDRSDRATFSARATATFDYIKNTFIAAVNAIATNAYNNAVEAAASATSSASQVTLAAAQVTLATAQATSAATSATAAALSANVTVWISGTTYGVGVQVQDPGDSYAIYTRIVGGAGATQPHLDTTNWRMAFPGARPLAVLTPTAAANVDALTPFTSSYDNYLILLDGIKPATDDVLRVRFAVAGVVDTGANYQAAATSFVAGGTVAVTLAAGSGVSGYAIVLNANDATNGKVLSYTACSQRDATPTFDSLAISQMYTAANAISGIRFYWSGGANFAATGKIRIYGYNNT